MIYEVIKPATGLEVGETYTPDEIGTKGDVNTMIRKGIIRGVGFLSQGSALSDSEAGRRIVELQEQLETVEAERDEARAQLRDANRKIRALEVGHAVGAKELAELRGELELERATKPAAGKAAGV